jgi:hypothetical protein
MFRASFTGLAVWRATMPRPPEVTCMEMFYGPRTKAGVNPHSQNEMFLFLVEQMEEGRRIPRERLHLVLQDLLADFGGDVMSYVRANVNDPPSWYHIGMIAWALADRSRAPNPPRELDPTRVYRLADSALRMAAEMRRAG